MSVGPVNLLTGEPGIFCLLTEITMQNQGVAYTDDHDLGDMPENRWLFEAWSYQTVESIDSRGCGTMSAESEEPRVIVTEVMR
jgi:hypothetical protein